jgi:hypothetical protein
MHIPRVQFGLRFLLVVILAVAFFGAALNQLNDRIPLAASFPLSAGFACYVTVLIVGLCTSLNRMKLAPAVYRRSAAGCAVILFSHIVNYGFQAAVIHWGYVTQDMDPWLGIFGWSTALEHLLWAAGFTLLFGAIQERGDVIAHKAELTDSPPTMDSGTAAAPSPH